MKCEFSFGEFPQVILRPESKQDEALIELAFKDCVELKLIRSQMYGGGIGIASYTAQDVMKLEPISARVNIPKSLDELNKEFKEVVPSGLKSTESGIKYSEPRYKDNPITASPSEIAKFEELSRHNS